MSDSLLPAITPVAAESVDTALAMLCARYGRPEDEADRRGRIRALVHSSRTFAQALDAFVQSALPHARGEHCAGDMKREAGALTQALADWTFSVDAAASTHRSVKGAPAASSAWRTEPYAVRDAQP